MMTRTRMAHMVEERGVLLLMVQARSSTPRRDRPSTTLREHYDLSVSFDMVLICLFIVFYIMK